MGNKMSNMQQVAIVREETSHYVAYNVVDASLIQKAGVFDQIEYDRTGNIRFSTFASERGKFADYPHFFVYSGSNRTQPDLRLAVQIEIERDVERIRSNPKQLGLDDIRARLSNAGYNVSRVVSPKELESKGKKDAGSEYEKPECAGCGNYQYCHSNSQDETSARGYQGSGVRFDSADGTRIRFGQAYTNRMARLLEEILLSRQNIHNKR